MTAARERPRRRRAAAALVAGAVLLGVAIVGLVVAGSGKPEPATAPVGPPAHTDNYAVVVGDPAAKLRIEVFEDFQCPACAEFEASAAGVLHEVARSGRARVDYHVLSFLGEASRRAANAAYCAADAGPEKFLALHDRLYAHQPPEDNSGYTEADLLAAGRAVGLPEDSYVPCVQTSRYAPYVTKVNDISGQRVESTPTVFVNGSELPRDAYTPQGLRRAVARAG